MKKYILLSGISICTLFILFIIGLTTNMLRFYKSSENPSNYPTFKPGQRMITSKLATPKLLDFICYEAENENSQKEIWMHRLCGQEGDTVEIREGILYINNKNADKDLPLSHEYYLRPSEFAKLSEFHKYDDYEVQYFGEDSMLTYASDKYIHENCPKANIKIIPKDSISAEIFKIYHQPWNVDNFGPIIVPAGKYFFLGDNRHISLDSRYSGFIDKNKYVGTVLFYK